MGKDDMQKTEAVQAPGNEAVEKSAEEEILSRKRRMALVSYLAVLFAVAFLLVTVSMVIENRQLQDSAGTLTSRIRQLQADNEKYQETNKKLVEANSSIGGLKDANTALQKEKEELETKNASLTEEASKLSEKAARTVQVHELLYAAVAANEEGDFEKLEELLEQIEPMKDLLCPTALEIYMELALA